MCSAHLPSHSLPWKDAGVLPSGGCSFEVPTWKQRDALIDNQNCQCLDLGLPGFQNCKELNFFIKFPVSAIFLQEKKQTETHSYENTHFKYNQENLKYSSLNNLTTLLRYNSPFMCFTVLSIQFNCFQYIHRVVQPSSLIWNIRIHTFKSSGIQGPGLFSVFGYKE